MHCRPLISPNVCTSAQTMHIRLLIGPQYKHFRSSQMYELQINPKTCASDLRWTPVHTLQTLDQPQRMYIISPPLHVLQMLDQSLNIHYRPQAIPNFMYFRPQINTKKTLDEFFSLTLHSSIISMLLFCIVSHSRFVSFLILSIQTLLYWDCWRLTHGHIPLLILSLFKNTFNDVFIDTELCLLYLHRVKI